MKMAAIAKASLALGILATGTITSLHQTVNASEHEAKYENVTKDIFDLRDYYSGASKELKNVTGYRYSKGGKHYLYIKIGANKYEIDCISKSNISIRNINYRCVYSRK
ncbi:TPA: hypothetical protein PI806_001910 [Staphylococcus aureus Z100565]|nr:hypothetical protein [Staphylococcus aureus Z100565]